MDVITTFAGNGKPEHSGDSGPASEAGLNRPHGVTVGPEGALYIGDTLNHRVRRVAKREEIR